MKRKHRVMVEITFEEPLTGKEAARRVASLIEAGNNDSMQDHKPGGYAQRYVAKEGERVISAEILTRRKIWDNIRLNQSALISRLRKSLGEAQQEVDHYKYRGHEMGS